jgi:hypothetical protein
MSCRVDAKGTVIHYEATAVPVKRAPRVSELSAPTTLESFGTTEARPGQNAHPCYTLMGKVFRLPPFP